MNTCPADTYCQFTPSVPEFGIALIVAFTVIVVVTILAIAWASRRK